MRLPRILGYFERSFNGSYTSGLSQGGVSGESSFSSRLWPKHHSFLERKWFRYWAVRLASSWRIFRTTCPIQRPRLCHSLCTFCSIPLTRGWEALVLPVEAISIKRHCARNRYIAVRSARIGAAHVCLIETDEKMNGPIKSGGPMS